MSDDAIFANPEGCPRFRSRIRVPPSGVSLHSYVVSIGKGPSVVRMTRRTPGSYTSTRYVYAIFRPRKRASKPNLDPTAIGGGVSQVAATMFSYQAVAFPGSAEKDDTRSRGAAITISVVTSTLPIRCGPASPPPSRPGS